MYATNPKVQTLSDGQGKFNLELFSECDSVYVSYTSYETQELSVFELKGVAQIELTDQALSVSEMIVTANRWEQDKAKVPNRIAKLNMKDAELLGSRCCYVWQ